MKSGLVTVWLFGTCRIQVELTNSFVGKGIELSEVNKV